MQTAGLPLLAKQIKKRLVDMERTQAWLIEQVANRTNLYFDRSYMHKVQTGQLASPKIVQAIREILEMPEQEQDAS